MQCPACDQTIRIGSRLCPYCGTWLVDAEGMPVTGPVATAPPRSGPRLPFPAAAPAQPTPAQPAPPQSYPAAAPPTMPTFTMPPPPPTAAPQTAPRIVIPQPGDLGSYGPPAPTQRVEAPAGAPPTFTPEPQEEFDEVTTLSARRKKPAYWTITLPNGVVELVTDRVVIGRHPEYMPALPTARLIPVPDPSRSVSKNHACFSLYGGNLVVEDLGSTNGIIITRPDGHEHDIGVGGRVELEDGAKVELGDVVLIIGKV